MTRANSISALALALAAALGGCTGPAYFKRSAISLAGADGTIATLFVWSNDSNAGMVTTNGEVCMQRAMTAQSMSAEGSASASVPSSVLTGMTAAAAAAAGQNDAEAAATISAAIAQAAASLSATSERTAFLDIGMFYLCQLSANHTLSPEATSDLTHELILAAAGMTPQGALVRVPAPDLPQRTED